MKFLALLIILLTGVSAFSQTDTKPTHPNGIKPISDEFRAHLLKEFGVLLKKAEWIEVGGKGETTYIDKVSAIREKNAVQFTMKSDKRGNLIFAGVWGDCLTDSYRFDPWMFQQNVGEEVVLLDMTKNPIPTDIAKPGKVIYRMLEVACREGIKPTK